MIIVALAAAYGGLTLLLAGIVGIRQACFYAIGAAFIAFWIVGITHTYKTIMEDNRE